MNTAQRLLSRYYETEQRKNAVPWIVGAVAVVAIALIIVISTKK